ncbi:MAG: TetR/AcrR family transcriptional regulator [Flavobacteriales bacterium]|nr:TetR/AcrR family transcriptional regulator [Flavobacteriales bacterium]MCW8913015.1 TetR/AcrR family transcriptional regulator [Flavobacteriales bacterium]MCW8938358.1 TetR/AcrR family transcriptional regulator [Flavobacteriales bacterium]MCW8940305.1 TetR/AcrR family transcriptional regulator [Flavobacteriales bacterium]MCW8969255.1 TetR/AcrR family transcriptional regulator [Flavobacteriales bacterium]
MNFSDRQIQIIEAATKRIDKFGIQELTIKNLANDLALSEAALYRHFNSKNEIMMGMLSYFIIGMKEKINTIIANESKIPCEILRDVFNNQLNTFVQNPAIVSVIFSEGIFQFNNELSSKLSEMMDLMHENITGIIKRGQEEGCFKKVLGPGVAATMIMGSMRMVVLKWKLSGNKSNLVKDGQAMLNGILKMMERKQALA